jgi:hypothetical protein
LVTEGLQSVLVGTIGLSIAAIAAAVLTLSREIRLHAVEELNRVRYIAVIALVLQCAHFSEEWITGFHRRFPEMLGLAPWSGTFFGAFNMTCIAIWFLCVAFLRNRPRILWFPLWFLAIASVVNGIVHPILSLAAGSYFPGLWTSPLVGIAGVVLLRALTRITSRRY